MPVLLVALSHRTVSLIARPVRVVVSMLFLLSLHVLCALLVHTRLLWVPLSALSVVWVSISLHLALLNVCPVLLAALTPIRVSLCACCALLAPIRM